MTIISGYAQLMAQTDEAGQREKYVEQILQQFDFLKGMTGEVLAFARGESTVLIRKVYMHRYMAQVGEHLRPHVHPDDREALDRFIRAARAAARARRDFAEADAIRVAAAGPISSVHYRAYTDAAALAALPADAPGAPVARIAHGQPPEQFG